MSVSSGFDGSAFGFWCARRVRAAVGAGLAAVMVAAGLGACGSPQADDGVLRNAGNGSEVGPIELAGPLPTEAVAAGPRVAQSQTAVVTDNVARSAKPYLQRPKGAPTAVEYRVFDVSNGGGPAAGDAPAIWSAKTSAAQRQISVPLINGRVYSWQWRPGKGGVWKDGGTFTAQFTSQGKGSQAAYAGVTTSLVTGEVSWGWTSLSQVSPTTQTSVALDWRGSNPDSGSVPPGWRLLATTGSKWAGLSESPSIRKVSSSNAGAGVISGDGELPVSVVLSDWDGGAMTFRLNDSGVYEVFTGLKNVPRTVAATLARQGDGKWVVSENGGVVTTFSDGKAVAVESKRLPVSSMSWDGDRLTGVSDSLGRTISLRYGGSGECPSAEWGQGWVNPPPGKLCAIDYPWGARSVIGYVDGGGGSTQIGLIKDPGNSGATLGWDSNGRLAGVRSSLANRAFSADPAAKDLFTAIRYDADGRASELVEAPAQPGGSRLVRTVKLPTISIADATANESVDTKITVSVIQPDGQVQPVKATGGSTSKQVTFDAGLWTAKEATDRAGLTREQETDSAGLVTAAVDEAGRRTEVSYDDQKRQIKLAGGVVNGTGLITTTEYDTDLDGDSLTGLQAQIFGGSDFSGDQMSDWWRSSPSALDMSFDHAPIGNGPWSALVEGVYSPKIVGKSQIYTFQVTHGPGSVVLFVDGQRCEADGQGRCSFNLADGPHRLQLELQVDDPDGKGYFKVKAGLGTAKAIPADQVGPGYSLTTQKASNDAHPGSDPEPKTVSEYAQPWTGLVSKQIEPGDLQTHMNYESPDPENSQWSRLIETKLPGGGVRAITYWGNTETDSSPDECGSIEADQAGGIKDFTREDGTRVSTWYDQRGLVIATRVAGPDATETICSAYDDGGTLISEAVFDSDGSLIERTTTDHAADGKAWVTVTTVEHGPAHPVSPGSSNQTRLTTDLAGRTIEYVDGVETVTTTHYDDLGQVSSETVKPRVGKQVAMAYEYEPKTGWLSKMTVNGVTAAKAEYDGSGQLTTVAYPAEVSQELAYYTTGQLQKVTANAPGATYVSKRVYTGAGRVVGDSLNATGSTPWNETRSYTFDAAQRLTTAKISGSTDITFDYGFGTPDTQCSSPNNAVGDSGLRTTGTRNGVAYATCYDDRGRPVRTSDPLITDNGFADITHDGMGRVTHIGGRSPLELSWAGGTTLATVREGDGDTATTTTMNTYAGRVTHKETKSADTTQRVSYSFTKEATQTPFFILDGDNGQVVRTTIPLPGAAQLTLQPDGTADILLAGADGSAMVTIPITDFGATTVAPPTLTPRYGPFGEILQPETPTTENTPLPQYGWQAAAGQETLTGTSGITLIGARPQHPALGQFLAPDPQLDSGTNLYSYTNGDPINASDPTGEIEWLDFLGIILGAVAVIATVVGAVATGGLAVAAAAVGTAVATGDLVYSAIETATKPSWQSVTSLVLSVVGFLGGAATLLKKTTTGQALLRRLRTTPKKSNPTTTPESSRISFRDLWGDSPTPRGTIKSDVRAESFISDSSSQSSGNLDAVLDKYADEMVRRMRKLKDRGSFSEMFAGSN